MKKEFEYWLRKIAKKSNGDNYKERTVLHYVSGIEATKKEFGIDFWNMSDATEVLEKKFELQCNDEYQKKDITGKKMYSCAIDRFIEFIYYKNNKDIDQEIVKIENNDNLSLDEKDGFIESIVNMRNPQFQRNFRRELFKEFHSKCALCEIDDKRLLIASHIIRYRDCSNKSDMYKSYNGLLLCVDHDALFDKHLISFDKNGNIMINKSIDERLYDLLNLNKSLKIDKKYLYEERLSCMKSHNERYNEVNNN